VSAIAAEPAYSWYVVLAPTAVDQFLLPAGCSAANIPATAAALNR